MSGLIAGVDEVGRGPLAGPVVAAAVILRPGAEIPGLTDSKRVPASRRAGLCARIREASLAWALGRAEVEEIDAINILQASLLAMRRAVLALDTAPRAILVDGTHCPRVDCEARAIVGGDLTEPAISAASVLAKVARDEEMIEMDARYPGYGFASHKGYPTRSHIDALRRLGACRIHRRSYAPVRRVLDDADA